MTWIAAQTAGAIVDPLRSTSPNTHLQRGSSNFGCRDRLSNFAVFGASESGQIAIKLRSPSTGYLRASAAHTTRFVDVISLGVENPGRSGVPALRAHACQPSAPLSQVQGSTREWLLPKRSSRFGSAWNLSLALRKRPTHVCRRRQACHHATHEPARADF